MNYRNKLMSLSLIALAVFSACSDEVENGTHPGKGDQRLSFAVSMGGANAWKPTGGTRAAADLGESTYELEPVEMEGKVNGKTVYLTAEVTDGFPGDNRPMTRGTQISETNKTAGIMDTFAISAYTAIDGTPDFMYNEKVILKKDEDRWYPEGNFYWPGKKQLSFYAWFPSAADGMTLTDNTHPGAPVMTYIVPDDVKKQQDVMSAVVIGKDNPTVDGFAITDLTFNHALSAVKFVAGDLMPQKFTIQSISLVGIKNKGSYGLNDLDWSLDDASTTDFTLSLNKVIDKMSSTAITADNETFFMLPQSFDDNSSRIEIVFTYANQSYTLRAALKGVTDKWEMGKTYTYTISTDMVVTTDVTFFKGTNGLDGNPYTSHNISANGDPFTIDYRYPTGITSLKARLAYELTDEDGNVTYEAFSDEYDLKGENSKDFISPCMNNLGDPTKAKKDDTPFVVQIKVENPFVVIMPSDPDSPDTQLIYDPSKGDNQWFTVWRGKMFPPNYILEQGNFSSYIGRKNLKPNITGNSTPYVSNITDMRNTVTTYWEVDVNHPNLGKSKWNLPSNGSPDYYCYVFRDNDDIFETVTYEIMKWSYRGASPGEDNLYGDAFIQKGFYWTNGDNGGGSYWIFCGQNDVNHSTWNFAEYNCAGFKRIDYQMTSVSYANRGVCGRGFANTGRK